GANTTPASNPNCSANIPSTNGAKLGLPASRRQVANPPDTVTHSSARRSCAKWPMNSKDQASKLQRNSKFQTAFWRDQRMDATAGGCGRIGRRYGMPRSIRRSAFQGRDIPPQWRIAVLPKRLQPSENPVILIAARKFARCWPKFGWQCARYVARALEYFADRARPGVHADDGGDDRAGSRVVRRCFRGARP